MVRIHYREASRFIANKARNARRFLANETFQKHLQPDRVVLLVDDAAHRWITRVGERIEKRTGITKGSIAKASITTGAVAGIVTSSIFATSRGWGVTFGVLSAVFALTTFSSIREHTRAVKYNMTDLLGKLENKLHSARMLSFFVGPALIAGGLTILSSSMIGLGITLLADALTLHLISNSNGAIDGFKNLIKPPEDSITRSNVGDKI